MDKELKEKIDFTIQEWVKSGLLSSEEEDLLKAIGEGRFREYFDSEIKGDHPLLVLESWSRLINKGVITPIKESDLITLMVCGDKFVYYPIFLNQ